MKCTTNFAVTALAALTFPLAALAVPTLQLGIQGGVYDGATDTVVAQNDLFKLNAYLVSNNSNTLSDTYYISYALVKNSAGVAQNPVPSLGSFTLNGNTINVTGDMVYGTPPADAFGSPDPGELPGHGIFDTYYNELAFQFVSGQQSAEFNVEDDAGDGPSDHPGSGMYWKEFTVDVAGLADGYAIHFDLYNTKVCTNGQGQCNGSGDVDQTEFAPFSHDAQSGGGDHGSCTGGNCPSIPEPETLVLLAIGLLGMGATTMTRRTRHRQ